MVRRRRRTSPLVTGDLEKLPFLCSEDAIFCTPVSSPPISERKVRSELPYHSQEKVANKIFLNIMPDTKENGATEETPLVHSHISDVESALDTDSNHSVILDEIFDRMDNEADRPWPATFERSISLLAGPTSDISLIDEITRSPRVTPNLASRRRVRSTYYKFRWLVLMNTFRIILYFF